MSKRIFDPARPLSEITSAAHDRIRTAVDGAADPDVLAADPAEWGRRLADSEYLDPPAVDTDKVEYRDLGPVRVDVTHIAGVTFSLSEMGRTIMRDGRRFEVRVPVTGRADLLAYSNWFTAHVDLGDSEVEGQFVVVTEDWPLVKGASELERAFGEYLTKLRDSSQNLAADVRRFNEELPGFAAQTIADRQHYIQTQQGFLDELRIPVARREDAPQRFTAPPIEFRRRPRLDTSPPKAPASAPKLGEFYAHILDVTRAMGVTMERAPASYADKDEETLRDQFLSMLNTHYQGQTYAEAFNKEGKTDILIRVGGDTLFIAECKWWTGRKALGNALDQLYGYSTWRDSRLALIIFVPSKDFSRVVDVARTTIEQRPEFVAWEPAGDRAAEMRCRIRWPQDPGRGATITFQLFHLPRV